uniref:Uncharacterized protein n=1 Tax=Branchiostoma floridae TaxID=7739 RepID=C3XXI2_BRAFL|eukprot:XP_002611432.1 hypothetical protein BRAFLDRAFT_117222 [Branchiostoma floridae]
MLCGGCCRLVTPNYSYHPPRADRNPFHRKKLPPCVNYDVLQAEVTNLTSRIPQCLAEFGLTDISTDLEELRDVGNILLKGPDEQIRSGNVTAEHFTRVGKVINLVYNVTVGGDEQLFAFTSPQLDNLTADDTLAGPIQSLQEDVEGFPTNYPAATAEAMSSLVQDFGNLLDSFNCSTNGSNCDLTRGTNSVVELDSRWTIVERRTLEYEPGGMRRAIKFRILFKSYRRLRIIIQIFIY